MNSNMTQYLELEIKFKEIQYLELEKKLDEYNEKFMWWNITEFGTIVGMFVALVAKSIIAWGVCAVAFIFAFVTALTYQIKTYKTLKEMEKLEQKEQRNDNRLYISDNNGQ